MAGKARVRGTSGVTREAICVVVILIVAEDNESGQVAPKITCGVAPFRARFNEAAKMAHVVTYFLAIAMAEVIFPRRVAHGEGRSNVFSIIETTGQVANGRVGTSGVLAAKILLLPYFMSKAKSLVGQIGEENLARVGIEALYSTQNA